MTVILKILIMFCVCVKRLYDTTKHNIDYRYRTIMLFIFEIFFKWFFIIN